MAKCLSFVFMIWKVVLVPDPRSGVRQLPVVSLWKELWIRTNSGFQQTQEHLTVIWTKQVLPTVQSAKPKPIHPVFQHANSAALTTLPNAPLYTGEINIQAVSAILCKSHNVLSRNYNCTIKPTAWHLGLWLEVKIIQNYTREMNHKPVVHKPWVAPFTWTDSETSKCQVSDPNNTLELFLGITCNDVSSISAWPFRIIHTDSFFPPQNSQFLSNYEPRTGLKRLSM